MKKRSFVGHIDLSLLYHIVHSDLIPIYTGTCINVNIHTYIHTYIYIDMHR